MEPVKLRKKLKRAALCVFRFGLFTGSVIALRSMLDRRSAKLKIPGLSAPVFVRGGGSDWTTFAKIFLEQDYRFDCPGFQPKVIIDAGANVGFATLFFAQQYPQAKIISIEPEPSNYAMLVKNTRSYPQVIPVHAALWNKPMALTISNPDADAWEFRVGAGAPGMASLRSVTIPELLNIAQTDQIDVLKIDIEGAEKDLFDSGYEVWLEKVRLLVIELHDRFRPGASSTFYRALTHYEFGQFPNGENIFVMLGRW